MKHANAARMTQVGQLDAEVPTLPDRFVPCVFVITTRSRQHRTRQSGKNTGCSTLPSSCFDIDSLAAIDTSSK